jgi:hypothetical protein
MAFGMSMQRLLTSLTRFESKHACTLPRVLVLTDERRGFSLVRQQKAWPKGVAFIERTFGETPTPKPKQSRAIQLASCSYRQARQAHLDGVHWPHSRLRLRRQSGGQGLSETASAHNSLQIARALGAGIKTVLVSTAFESASPSAKRPLGPCRLAILARRFPQCALFALGGINDWRSRRLHSTGVYGIALVGFSTSKRD